VNFPFYRHHRCPFCGAADALSEDILVKAAVVVLTWRCAACEAEWQPSADEQLKPERRVGPPDRRRVSRGDRRKR
jgi:transcription elongation factor Elf1